MLDPFEFQIFENIKRAFFSKWCPLTVLVILVVFYGCARTTQGEAIDRFSKEFAKLNLMEITELDADFLRIQDMNFGKIFSTSKSREAIFVHSIEGERIARVDLVGEGPNKISDVHNVYGYSENQFVVHDIKGVYVYDFLAQKFSYKCNDIYYDVNVGTIPTGFKHSDRSLVFSTLNPSIPLSSEEYYENPEIFYFSRLNLKTCDSQSFGNVASNSIYKEKLLPVRERGYIERIGNDHIVLYFQFDKSIQIYNIEKFEKTNEISLSLPFNEVFSARDRSLQEVTRISQINPAIIRMKVTNDERFIVVQYLKGQDDYLPAQEYLDGSQNKPQRWIDVFDLKEKKKVASELKMPSNRSLLLEAPTLDSIYFSSNINDNKEGTFLTRYSLK